ncbi:MAG: hypothetical protein P4L26_11705 [Terracidiphilus sp.]|nr:hypothetical protein [Terracidiphilus sp.]
MTEETQQEGEAGTAEAGLQTPETVSAGEDQPQTDSAVADPVLLSPPSASPQSGFGRIYIFGVAAAVLGILAGIAFADFALRPAAHTSSRDLGSVAFSADGLKGHLILNWDKQPAYRLVVEPGDPARHEEFSIAVGNPPRPLSVLFQLRDSAGYVLCFKSVLVKFDPRRAAAIAATASGPQAGAVASGIGSADQAELAGLEARELERERGQDLFQLDAGPDGQASSIAAQGAIPCSGRAYEEASSWSFSPDFPALDEQADWLKRAEVLRAVAGASAAQTSAAQASFARLRAARKKALEEPTPYALEGDDELVGFDPSRGIVKTSTGETFIVVKAAAPDNAARWQDLPATIHFKCNLNAVCALTRRGADALYARLKR